MTEQLRLTEQELLEAMVYHNDADGHGRNVADAATAKAIAWCCQIVEDDFFLSSREFHEKYRVDNDVVLVHHIIKALARAEGVEVKNG